MYPFNVLSPFIFDEKVYNTCFHWRFTFLWNVAFFFPRIHLPYWHEMERVSHWPIFNFITHSCNDCSLYAIILVYIFELSGYIEFEDRAKVNHHKNIGFLASLLCLFLAGKVARRLTSLVHLLMQSDIRTCQDNFPSLIEVSSLWRE